MVRRWKPKYNTITDDMYKIEQIKMAKLGKLIYSKPLENKLGISIIDQFKLIGGKYLSDLPD